MRICAHLSRHFHTASRPQFFNIKFNVFSDEDSFRDCQRRHTVNQITCLHSYLYRSNASLLLGRNCLTCAVQYSICQFRENVAQSCSHRSFDWNRSPVLQTFCSTGDRRDYYFSARAFHVYVIDLREKLRYITGNSEKIAFPNECGLAFIWDFPSDLFSFFAQLDAEPSGEGVTISIVVRDHLLNIFMILVVNNKHACA